MLTENQQKTAIKWFEGNPTMHYLTQRIIELEAVLKFYAEMKMHEDEIFRDAGYLARRALGKEE